MSNLVKFSQLKHIVAQLWDSSKKRFFDNVEFNKETKMLTFFKDGVATEIALDDFASLSMDNHFTGKNVFTEELYINEHNVLDLIKDAGTVKKVNGKLPNELGEIVVEIEDIAGLKDELDSKVLKSSVVTTATPHMIPQLDAQGKIYVDMLPELAINRVTRVETEEEALELVLAGTVQTGDIIIHAGDDNKVYMCVGETGEFATDFLLIHFGDGSVLSVNGQIANANGEVVINAKQLNLTTGEVLEDKITAIDSELDAIDSKLVEVDAEIASIKENIVEVEAEISDLEAEIKAEIVDIKEEASKKVKTISGVAAIEGNVELAFAAGEASYELKANGTKIAEIPFMTEAEVQEIVGLFV